MAIRKCIRLNPFEHQTLAALYLQRRIATDRYMHRLRELRDLTATFNAMSDRVDSPEEVLHYMQTKRRSSGQWPTLDGTHKRLAVVLGNLIEPEFVPVLRNLYTELNHGAEAYIQVRTLGRLLERRFFQVTGVEKPASTLATAMLELRKDGLLPTLPRCDKGFNDFDEAEGQVE